jgi:hypothetical protein
VSKNSLAARAAAVTFRPDPDSPETQAAHGGVAPPRARPVKLTVEVSPGLYSMLKAYPDEAGLPEATGKARIPSVEVFRALLEELAVNKELREHVATRIRENVTP